MTRLMILSFIIPLGPVIPVGVNKQIENPGFGSVCFVIINTNSALAGDSTLQSHGDTQGNTVTSNKRRRQTARGITQFLEKQWRSGAMAICLISVDMIYWLFYFIDAKKMTNVSPSTPWFVSWVTCLVENAATNLLLAGDIQGAGEVAQAACASVSRPHVPSFTWAAVSDLFPALLGIMTVVIFGSKLEMWRELRHELFGRFSREDKTIFVMDDIRKEDQSHQPTQYPSQEKLQQQAQDHVDKELFNSGEITLNSNNAHDILTYNYTSWAKGDSIITSPTKATSFSTAATYGGATRKASFKIVDDREPILYHNPDLEAAALSQQKSEQQQKEYALNVTEGSVPWPSWPTTTYTSPRQESPISNGRRPNLTVKTRDDLRSFQTSSPLASPPSQTSPASTEFYDAEDFIGSPTSAYGSLRSGYNANILNRSNSHSPVVNEAFNKNRVYDRTGAPISSTSTSSSSPTLANAHGSPLGAYSPRPAIPQKNNLRRG
ncbi:hypothetical protein BGZ46_010856 [Entomortierella lignicola]|nr:hypothetical protein BGZ46_010856 [Entomortierella lignicola]